MRHTRRALCALLLLTLAGVGAAKAAAKAARSEPHSLDADALRALSARLEDMARDVERALAASNSSSTSAAAAAKLEYLQDALHVRLRLRE